MEVTRGEFTAYEDVRMSGITNMFDTRAVEAYSGLSKDTILEIMQHYSVLKKYLQVQGHRNLFEVIKGTGKVGSVIASYDDIVAVYGKPFTKLPDDKIDVQWMVETEHGIVTIHNYKDGISYLGENGKDIREIEEWSVGATNQRSANEVVARIYDYVKERSGNRQ